MEQKIAPSDILLFENSDNGDFLQVQNHLRVILRFIKGLRVYPIPEIAYIPPDDNLLPEMSLKENLIHQKQNRFNFFERKGLDDIIEATNNPFVKKLSRQIQDFDRIAGECPPCQRKLGSIIKGLLNPAAIVSVVNPNSHLSEKQQEDFFNALLYEAQSEERILILNGIDQIAWHPHIKKKVKRDSFGQYVIHPYSGAAQKELTPFPPLQKVSTKKSAA